jgi:hypothetical protein
MYRLTWLTWKLWVIPHVPSQSVFILCIFTMAVVLRGRQEPGGICVSRTVCNHVRNKVGLAFEAMGEHKVKNIAEPITVYWPLALPGNCGRHGGCRCKLCADHTASGSGVIVLVGLRESAAAALDVLRQTSAICRALAAVKWSKRPFGHNLDAIELQNLGRRPPWPLLFHRLVRASASARSAAGSQTPTDFIALAESLGCSGAVSGNFSPFVCTGNRNRVNMIIGALCEATIP